MTAFTTERWAQKMLFALKESKGGFAARVVNHNFHNPGGDRADAVKVINPDITVVGTATTAGTDMPAYNDAASATVTINLDTPLKYAVGLPWEMNLKTEHDVNRGYGLLCEDLILQQRNALVHAAIFANNDIPVVSGTAASPTQLTKTNIKSMLTKFRVQLMKTGAIMENGHYRFVDLEEQENQSELAGESTPLEGEGADVPGPLAGQAQSALPVLGVPSAIYELIEDVETDAGKMTEDKEFYGHVKVFKGFEIVLDDTLDHTADSSNKHLQIVAATRNMVTECFTRSRAEIIPDKDKYRDILRGMIVYGCKVIQPKCAARGYFTVA